MDIKIIYEDNDVLVADKPAGIIVFEEGKNPSGPRGYSSRPFLINELIKRYPDLKNAGEAPRYGIVHRLDKDTSGVLLVAKSNEALIFLQKQFINREVEKKYICLVEETIKDDSGKIETLIGRAPGDKRKQKAYLPNETGPGRREAITEYKVLERFKDYTLLEVEIKTGRRHQIRCHFSYLQHPIAGDKLYGFKNSKVPEGLTRQFLHAQKLKIQLPFDAAQGRPNGKIEEFKSELPEELANVLKILNNKF